jgi:hypothetical protein
MDGFLDRFLKDARLRKFLTQRLSHLQSAHAHLVLRISCQGLGGQENVLNPMSWPHPSAANRALGQTMRWKSHHLSMRKIDEIQAIFIVFS